MILRRALFAAFVSLALCIAVSAQTTGNVVVLQTELQNISGNAWLPNSIKDLMIENLQKYTKFSTVVDEEAERKVKEQQRRSESTAHSESDIIEIGKLVNAKFALFSYSRRVGNKYTLTVQFTDLTTGEIRVSVTSKQYDELEKLYSHPGAVDEVTLGLCERLDISLSATEKYVLQNGDVDLTIEQQEELEKKETERFEQQRNELNKQLSIALKMSSQAESAIQQAKIEAQLAFNEQNIKASQERAKRLFDEQKKRQADMIAEANRESVSIQKRNAMSAELDRIVKELRAANVQNFNIMERISFLETKKKTFNELQEELSKRKAEIDREADGDFKAGKAEIEASPWRAADLSNGKPTETALGLRNKKVNKLEEKLKAQAEKEKSAVEKELQPKCNELLNDIFSEYRFLEKNVVTISSIRSKNVQYSVGAFDGEKNSWPIRLYFYNDGKESIGQYEASVPYQKVTGKKLYSEMKAANEEQEERNYNDFRDEVDVYSSLFARNAPVLTYEVDYTVEPWIYPSQYRICFQELRVKNTKSEEVLLREKMSDLSKVVSFPECRIPAKYYAQIVNLKDKNIPAYILYQFALAAGDNGNDEETATLMRRAADKKYAPALEYFERKKTEERERERMEAQAKADEEARIKKQKEMEERAKKERDDKLYSNNRFGLCFSADFSPSIQNCAIEAKYDLYAPSIGSRVIYEYGIGANLWLKKGHPDAWSIYFSGGMKAPSKRIKPYVEFGGGPGKFSKAPNVGTYAYMNGGLEMRLSPRVSIDVFCKPQWIWYSVGTGEKYVDKKDGKTKEKQDSHTVGCVSGGVGVTFWKNSKLF